LFPFPFFFFTFLLHSFIDQVFGAFFGFRLIQSSGYYGDKSTFVFTFDNEGKGGSGGNSNDSDGGGGDKNGKRDNNSNNGGTSTSSGVSSDNSLSIRVFKSSKKNNYFVCIRDFIAVGGGFDTYI
jgi:hypothetical protein